MPEWYKNILCVSKPELTDAPNALMSEDGYKSYVRRHRHVRVREGKGLNSPALLNYDLLRHDLQAKYNAKYGNPRKDGLAGKLRQVLQTDYVAIDYYATYQLPTGKLLPAARQAEYVANACMLQALASVSAASRQFIKALGGNSHRLWPNLAHAAGQLKAETGHSLPGNHLRLKQKVEQFAKAEGNDKYLGLIPDKYGNANASKVKDLQQESTMRQLLSKHQNFDNEQIALMYNIVAENLLWDKVTAQTVANYRKKFDLHTIGGRAGEAAFDNQKAMLIKRKAPSHPLYYWTLDGWDAELLYQSTNIDKKGHNLTTYHNRPTMVVVLDPSVKYPVGYAIGTHETPELIRQALRNAVQHTKELFGNYHKVLQLQSDRYGGGKLRSIYEFIGEKYTPARAHNAKAKTIEPWFNYFNKKYCQMMPNWSGFGVASGSKKQPNAEYLNKIRHSFPDAFGVKHQLEYMVEMERNELRAAYMAAYADMPEADKKPMPVADFLNILGETTGFVNRLTAPGVVATINGEEKVFDSFDPEFRYHAHESWCLKYNPDDTSQVLAVNAKGHNGKLLEVIGTQRFLLEEKYVQPMALRDRTEDDVRELKRVGAYNNSMKAALTQASAEDAEQVRQLFANNPQLNNTLAKLVLVDSMGQHKDRKSAGRIGASAAKLAERHNRKQAALLEKSWAAQQEAYLDSKVDVSKYFDT